MSSSWDANYGLASRVRDLDESAASLLFDWVSEYLDSPPSEDSLMDLFEFSRRRLQARDGFVPGGRRASVDFPSTLNPREEVLREMAEALTKEKSEAVSSFVKGWIDVRDDPTGIVLETPMSSCSPVGSVVRVSESSTPSAIGDIELSSLLSWESPFLSFSSQDLVSKTCAIFTAWGFHTQLPLPRDKFTQFVKSVGKHYRPENPYHNFHHAHSVLAVVGNLMRSCLPSSVFSPLEEFSVLVAALCHDVGHRALNSDYYIKTRHELAIQYNDVSVLENMHCSLSFDLIRQNDFTKTWTDDQYTTFRRIFIQCVLATDMKSHFELTGNLIQLQTALGNLSTDAEVRKTVYCALVHAADLSNPLMPTRASYDWAFRVVEEMHAQGKLEERGGYAVAPFMKHPPTDTFEFANLQLSFIGFIAAPLWRAMAAMWPELNERIAQLETNTKFWEELRDKGDHNIPRVDSGPQPASPARKKNHFS